MIILHPCISVFIVKLEIITMQLICAMLLTIVSFPPHFLSHHWFAVQSDRGWSIRHLPSPCRRQLRPGLLFHGVPWKPHGVSRPGDVKRRGSQDLDHWPPLPDGWNQWWGLAGQTAAYTWSISFIERPANYSFSSRGSITDRSANLYSMMWCKRKSLRTTEYKCTMQVMNIDISLTCVCDVDEADVWGGWQERRRPPEHRWDLPTSPQAER